ncbi:MAG TPA: hypothetical protein VFM37_04060 [Pseudonocardiaceae bacterium]|nr:hypothetical protein [Pseudonocardiaceae bacterium]
MNTTTTEQPEQPVVHRPGKDLWAIVVVILAVIAGVVAVAVVALSGEDGTGSPAPGATPSAAPSAGPPVSPSAGLSVTPSVTNRPAPFGYQPLWPFTNPAEVQAWQQAYRSGGHAPWHLDARATALGFTTGYLGFTGINVVVSSSVNGDEALVAVGYPIEGRAPGTAAVLHLARYGAGADRPWEVVGTKDTYLTLTQPRYGAKVSSPMTVGGRITGVDESIRVQVRQPASPAPIGETEGLPAGGENTPWSTTVEYHGATAPALTVVASTGGHYTDVERFAITGVRP